jgi:hypothetical protein
MPFPPLEEILELDLHVVISADPLLLAIARQFQQAGNLIRLAAAADTHPDDSPVRGDMLRAVVVFAHAALEETIRAITRRRTDIWPQDALNKVPLADEGDTRADKFYLGRLKQYCGSTVDEVLARSVDSYLNQMSFTSCRQIVGFLTSIGVDVQHGLEFGNVFTVRGEQTALLQSLDEMIQRRHVIVHNQDYDPRNVSRERLPIDSQTATRWVCAVMNFSLVLILQEASRHDAWKELFRQVITATSELMNADPSMASQLTEVLRGLGVTAIDLKPSEEAR